MNATPKLLRALGPWTATAIVVGTVIGSGVFRKPYAVANDLQAFGVPFGLVALAWILGGLLAFLGSLAYAEVAVLYPRAGGNYVFLREGYGRLFGFLWGWVEFWIIRSGSLAALATVFTDSLHDVLRATLTTDGSPVFEAWMRPAITVVVILALAAVNIRGVRWGGILQLFITLLKVGSLVGIGVLPFVILGLASPQASAPTTENLQPVWPTTWNMDLAGAFGAALLGVLWAYHGWMNLTPVAEEIKEPQRNIPLALFGGIFIIIVLYLSANFAYSLTLPHAEMLQEQNKVTVAAFSLRLLGPIGLAIASAIVMTSVFGALNGNLLVGPRLLYAMGEDRLAPRILSKVHTTYRTPAAAILVLAAWSCLMVVTVATLQGSEILSPKVDAFDLITNFAMFGAISFETLSVTTIFVFRWRYPQVVRSYRCWGYPVVPAVYTLVMALVLANMFWKNQVEALTGVGFMVVGALVYAALGLNRTGDQNAIGDTRIQAEP